MYKLLKYTSVVSVLIVNALVISCKKDDQPVKQPTVVSGAGNISARVNEFRTLLGDPLNVTPGNAEGRREINWDGVPDQFINTSIPKFFFNPTEISDPASRKRGFAYASDGDFRVSDAGFSTIEPSLASQLSTFSGNKIFANISSDLWHTQFQVPGEAKPATVRGFGAVFVDVDIANLSFLEFFAGDKSLGKFFVPPHDQTTSLSFLGVYFDDADVTSVHIRHGNGIITAGAKDISTGGVTDIVAMDDFLYSEPRIK